MSRTARDWAWKTPVRGVTKLLLLALAEHADDAGVCWPKIETLVERTGLSRTAVKDGLRALEASGALKIEQGVGRSRPSVYTVVIGASLTDMKTVASRPLSRGKEGREPTASESSGGPENGRLASEKGRLPSVKGSGDDRPVESPKGLSPRTGQRTVSEPGAGAAAASPGSEKSDGLFDEPDHIITAEVINAGHAAAAWTDSYAETHSGKPTSRARAQAARECRQLLEAGNAGDLVLAAARQAGARGFATVEREFHAMTKVADPTGRHLAVAQPKQQQVGTGTQRAQAILRHRRGTPA